jgi:DNA-binding transcriptional MerR regulator
MKQCKEVRIGELANLLKVEPFVIRFWEKEFELAAQRTAGGQRVYTAQQVNQFKKIKQLLYNEGFTIAGAKKMLTQGVRLRKPHVEQDASPAEAPSSPHIPFTIAQLKELHQRLCALRAKL